jgi:four helix bundle protein
VRPKRNFEELNPNIETRNPKQAQMTEARNPKQYDLEARTLAFAKDVRTFLKQLPNTIGNVDDKKQLARASGSVGANYIEANEALSKKEFAMRVKICRKEAKECGYWLELLDANHDSELTSRKQALQQEAIELTSIFGAIVRKTE